MKKLVVPALLLSCVLILSARADGPAPAAPADVSAGGLRFSIMVTKFESRRIQWQPVQPLGHVGRDADRFAPAIGEIHDVLGQQDMRDAAMKEQDFAKSGRVAGGDKAPTTGNMTPAQLLVKGVITNFQTTSGQHGGVAFGGVRLGGGGDSAEINAEIYVVDSTTGQVVASKKVLGQVKGSAFSVGFTDRNFSGDIGGFKKTNVGTAMEHAIDDAVAFIVTQIPTLHWSGNVVLVKAPQVYINRGSREGVVAGETFKVGTSEILRDPATGETLDVAFTEKGQIKVQSVKEKISICTIVSGDGLENGMAVVPLTP